MLLAAATYFFTGTRVSRTEIAFGSAILAFFIGGFGIYVLAVLDGLAACPP